MRNGGSAVATGGTGSTRDALKLRQERVPLIEALVKQGKLRENDLVNAKQLVADSFGLVAHSHLRLGNLQEAIDNYQASDKAFASLPASRTRTLNVRRARAEIQVRLGRRAAAQNKAKEARKHYQAALDQRKELVRLTPRPPAYNALVKSDLALSYQAMGDYCLMADKDAAAAMQQYGDALAIYDEMLMGEPDNLDLKERVSAIYYRLGYVAEKQNGLAALAGMAPWSPKRGGISASLLSCARCWRASIHATHGLRPN